MIGRSRLASAAVGGLMLLGTSVVSSAQGAGPRAQPAGRTTAVDRGSIQGMVSDEKGAPIANAMVSALGLTTTFAVTDQKGRFELTALPPGSYSVRAHLTGYSAPRPQRIEVRASERASSFIALQRGDADAAPILAAGFGVPASFGASEPANRADDSPDADVGPDETAWRLRHSRRGVLKEASIRSDLFADDTPANVFTPLDRAGRAAETSVRLATSFITDTPFSGQVNFLTSGSFETPRELFSQNSLSRGTAYVRLTAPAGSHADWTVQGALTQADISSWLVAGSYVTRETAATQHGFGVSYSTQRYDGGNPLALREVTDGSRNVGEIYGFSTLSLLPALTLTYGGRYAQYDYLENRNLISPRLELVLTPDTDLRISGVLTQRSLAPGAEEFLPPGDTGIWLPPQKTFSALEPGRPLTAERTLHAAIEVERSLGDATIAFKVMHQRSRDQLMTLFGAEMPDQPSAKLGHYVVGSAGDTKVTGGAASFETSMSKWVRGSVEYSLANARLRPVDDLRYIVLMPPSAVRPQAERIHDVAARIETEVPETATRLLLVYRVGNAFAHASQAADGSTSTRRALDSRFDLQVRQSLPFMDFRTAKWEMLVAVRNFFRETSAEQSIYDELLVVRPPKRIVGGITMLF